MPSTLARPHACSRHLRLEYRPSIPPLALSITIISLPFYSPPTPAPPLAPSPNDATTHGTRRVSPPLPHPVSHSHPPFPGRPLCRLRIPFLPAHTMPPHPRPRNEDTGPGHHPPAPPRGGLGPPMTARAPTPPAAPMRCSLTYAVTPCLHLECPLSGRHRRLGVDDLIRQGVLTLSRRTGVGMMRTRPGGPRIASACSSWWSGGLGWGGVGG